MSGSQHILPKVLLVGSTRSQVDLRESLRLCDLVSPLVQSGWQVDVLVPRVSKLLRLSLCDRAVRLIGVPPVPFAARPPRKPGLRRLCVGFLMMLRAIALITRRDYAVVHGLNDGAVTVHLANLLSIRRVPWVADITDASVICRSYRGLGVLIAHFLQRRALRRAHATVFADGNVVPLLKAKIPASRLSVIPEPRATNDLAQDVFTHADFNEAFRKIYRYVTRNNR